MPKTTESGAPGPRLGSAKQISSTKLVAPAVEEAEEAEAGDGESEDDACGDNITIIERLNDLDLLSLAERVFALLREEVRVERQRLGRNW